jgi:hypothetical protein
MTWMIAAAMAGMLDLSAQTTGACDPQWVGACLSPDVWGPEDSLGVTTVGSMPVLTMGSDAAIALGQGTFAATGVKGLNFRVAGNAHSTATKVGLQVRYFNASDVLLATVVVPVHNGASGVFNIHAKEFVVPANARSWKARLAVEDDGVALASVGVACARGCGPGEEDYPVGDGGSTGDTGSPESTCEECEENCDDETALGCVENGKCTAVCLDIEESMLPMQAGVDL